MVAVGARAALATATWMQPVLRNGLRTNLFQHCLELVSKTRIGQLVKYIKHLNDGICSWKCIGEAYVQQYRLLRLMIMECGYRIRAS